MPSIALPATVPTAGHFFTNAAAPAAPQLQSRISTSLTDVTIMHAGAPGLPLKLESCRGEIDHHVMPERRERPVLLGTA